MIDFHTHIMPEIDDGSSSDYESVELLKMLKEQGVNKVLLTPHFYAYSSSAETFDELRESSLKMLFQALSENPVDIELYLGCEVYYFEELWRVENLRSFCIKGTDYILIEMPFSAWTDNMIRGIEKIIGKGLTPIIAHFERYISYGNMPKIYELVEMGALLQMNCDYINRFFTRRKAISFIRKDIVAVLGTDCHNIYKRRPEYLTAVKHLRKKLSKERFNRFFSFQRRLLAKAEPVYSQKQNKIHK